MLSLFTPTNGCCCHSTWPSPYITFWPWPVWFRLLAFRISLAAALSLLGRVTSYPVLVPELQSPASAKSAPSAWFHLYPDETAVESGHGCAIERLRFVRLLMFDRVMAVFVPPPKSSLSSLDDGQMNSSLVSSWLRMTRNTAALMSFAFGPPAPNGSGAVMPVNAVCPVAGFVSYFV